jgi:hypothetical protein
VVFWTFAPIAVEEQINPTLFRAFKYSAVTELLAFMGLMKLVLESYCETFVFLSHVSLIVT